MPLRLCVPFVGDSVGGSHISALLLLQHLSGVTTEIVLHRAGPLEDYLRRYGFNYTMAPCDRLLGESRTPVGHAIDALRAVPTLLRHLRHSRPHCIYTNDLRMHLSWAAAAQATGTPHLWHQRTRWANSRLVRLCAQRTPTFIAISAYCESTFPSALRGRTRLIRDPVLVASEDRAAARQHLLDEIGAPPESRLIGFVGNLTDQKRPRIFLEAAQILAASPTLDCRFLLFGAGRNLETTLINLAEATLPGRVHFLGFRDPIGPAIAGLDVLLAPGVDEAFGRTAAEAMMLGTPVVASASGGHLETIDHKVSGLLVQPDNPALAAAAVQTILDHPERGAAMSVRAREIVKDRFSLARHVQAVEAILIDLALNDAS